MKNMTEDVTKKAPMDTADDWANVQHYRCSSGSNLKRSDRKCLGYSETKSLRGRYDERKNCRFERF